jgi:methionyl-tRNA synthetase
MSQRFYVTTPIYYVNGAPHIGHAYTTLVADALARYYKLRGRETHFLTGTDEHGLKIQREAAARGMTPLAFATENAERFRALWPALGVRPDDFLRTTEARHVEAVQRWWKVCADNGDIYLGRYKGLYCVACEGYKTEKELLPGGLCPVHERPVETLEEETYFFRLSKYADKLLELYRTTDFLQPETRRNEMISFVSQGLDDLSISRTTFDWGIPVPGDPRHVVYVWFDALFNYRSAVEGTEAERFWPPDVQLVAKDIVRFHTVYWPAFLMSAGLPLPKTVFSHGYVLSGGKKTSKTPGLGPRLSTGTTDPVRIAAAVGSDALRYYLLREVSFGQDGEFSLPGLISRARAELAETVGNLLHRTLPFVAKHFDGCVPAVDDAALTEAEEMVRNAARNCTTEAARSWEHFAPHRALEVTQLLARLGNQYFDTQTPWKLARDPALKPRLGVVIGHVLELLHTVAVMLSPALPDGADALRTQLGLGPLAPTPDRDLWPHTWGQLPAGTRLQPGAPLFPKYDAATEAAILASLDVRPLTDEPSPVTEAPAAPVSPAPEAPVAPEAPAPIDPIADAIAFDDFAKVDLRVGTVLQAERIPKKDMLLKLSVDLGEATGPRTILAGIAKAFAPEALIGRQVVVVANLAPRDFGKGMISHGMLLAAGPKEGLTLAGFDKHVPPGTRVK